MEKRGRDKEERAEGLVIENFVGPNMARVHNGAVFESFAIGLNALETFVATCSCVENRVLGLGSVRAPGKSMIVSWQCGGLCRLLDLDGGNRDTRQSPSETAKVS